jgi:hypothetical protein
MHMEQDYRLVNRINAIISIALAASLILGCRGTLLASPSVFWATWAKAVLFRC